MNKNTRHQLFSSVDASGNPNLNEGIQEDLSEDLEGGIPRGILGEVGPFDNNDNPASSDLEQNWVLEPTVRPPENEQVDTRSRFFIMVGALGLFLLALLPRLYVLFFITNPQNPGLGWYGDTFHHWQIAYLSKEIGFSHSFLRLWDFKGMEYFWGLLHPLVLSGLFKVTGSVDIVILRLVSAVGASIYIAMLFFLLRRYFNLHVALAGALLTAFNPVGVFSDSIGMQEPLGLALFFAGLLLWPRRAAWTGVLWALAGTVRAEYWVFGAGLVAAAMLVKEETQRKIAIGLGWVVPSLLYMKYLLDHTGNPIYPVYWNFLGNVAGEWMEETILNYTQVLAQRTARITLLATCLIAVWILWKRPKSYLFILLGLGNIIFLGMMWGYSAYIYGFISRFIYDRLLVVPYMYLGIFLTILFLYLLPKLRLRRFWLSMGWISILIILAISQLAWGPLLGYYEPLNDVWATEVHLAEEVASYYDGGTLVIPEDRPGLTYALVQYHGITAENLMGQMYDPFAYFEMNDPFAVWDESRLALENWFVENDIHMIVFYNSKQNYQEMVLREPDWFNYLGTTTRVTMEVYRVTVSGDSTAGPGEKSASVLGNTYSLFPASIP